MSNCARIDKWFGGCRFEPRYDEKPRDYHVGNYEGSLTSLRKYMTLEVYVHDICIRCGRIVKRDAA